MDELFKKLESVDTQESSQAVSRLQKRLSSAREPQLLGELIDYFASSGSKQALKVLASLKDVQSQDFFSKLNECLHSKVPTRLPVLRLLAHSLNKQTSWMYKIVQHPLFMSILHYLKISHDVLVLTSGVLVLAAILPLSPSHLSLHLPDIFQIFADLATVRSNNRLRLAPRPLYLHLDVAVYYLFLQLYALFPCNFFTFLRGRYGPLGERSDFRQYIAPLFNYVQFHPGLVVDSNATETHGDKWRSMEPDEVATLSLSVCLDLAITSPLEDGPDPGSVVAMPTNLHSIWEPTSESPPQHEGQPLKNNLRIVPPETPSRVFLHPPAPLSDPSPSGTNPLSRQSSCYTSDGTPSPVKGVSPRTTRRQQSGQRNNTGGTCSLIRDDPNADWSTAIAGRAAPSMDTSNLAGFKSTSEMIWSPSVMFDPSISLHRPSSTSQANGSTVHSSTIPSPSPESSVAADSMPGTSRHTPRPMTAPTFTYANYSPTASVGGEPLSRQPSNQATPTAGISAARQQSMHFQDSFEGGDPFISGGNRLSQSLYVPPTSGRARKVGKRVLRDGLQGEPLQSASLKNRFEKLFSIFSSSRKSGDGRRTENEDFTEIFTSDVNPRPSSRRSQSVDGAEPGVGGMGVSGVQAVRGRVVTSDICEVGEEEVGEEALALDGDDSDDGAGVLSEENECVLESVQADGGAQREEGGWEQEEGGVDGGRNDSEDTPDQSTAIPLSSVSEPRSPLLPASFPGGRPRQEGSRQVQRQRASQSDSVTHTVQQVQERLKQLAESQGEISLHGDREDTSEEEGEERGWDTSTPKNRSHTLLPQELSGGVLSEAHPSQISQPNDAVDSTTTPSGSVPHSKLVASHNLATARSLDTNEAGGSSLTGSLLQERRGSSFQMRRVSVCDRKGVNFGTQTNSLGVGNSPTNFNPSPVSLLDQLVKHGEILHEGNAQDIPLTELEGIDWFRFGGCPHNEELGQMQSQVALLHSQLLFERYQCLQHARRNRRLLSKARNAHRIREELEHLRHQCWRESVMRRSLEQVQGGQGAGAERGEGGEVERLRAENRALLKEKRSVQADNHRQTVELCRLQEENSRLTREAKETRERVFALESERAHVQPQLARARSLQEKVTALERELLVLDRLYHRQREETHSLLAQGKREQEWTMLTSTLRKEKEAAERERASLLQEIEGLKIVVASLREEGQRAEEEKAVLQQILQHVQGRCQEKIKASEEKYEAAVTVTHQLENLITELRGRSVTRKKPSLSHSTLSRPSPSPAQTTPSPLTA